MTRVAAGARAALALAAMLLMACGADPSWTPREFRDGQRAADSGESNGPNATLDPTRRGG
ncbi:MAG TPA: hypothetical protein VK837_05055 [Longimicrobiales bacterium]|nr:hypothetical protein [Longimicrobiales bacterium]